MIGHLQDDLTDERRVGLERSLGRPEIEEIADAAEHVVRSSKGDGHEQTM